MTSVGPGSVLRRLAPLLATLFAVHACEMPTAPGFPEDAIPFDPPPAYAAWWELTAACAGVDRDFGSVRWYVVPGARSIPYGDAAYQGLWYRAGNRIVLAEQSTKRGGLVRHEMLHALIGQAAHPPEFYKQRCGGIVVCAGECAEEAGPDAQPPAGTPQLSSTELELSMQIVSSAPDVQDGTSWVGVMVSATNSRSGTRVVRLGAAGARPPFPTFGYALTGGAAASASGRETYEFAFDTAMVFGPGETRRRLFDLWLPSSEWEVRGLFASGATSATRFAVER